jgi:hypothetical protein
MLHPQQKELKAGTELVAVVCTITPTSDCTVARQQLISTHHSAISPEEM